MTNEILKRVRLLCDALHCLSLLKGSSACSPTARLWDAFGKSTVLYSVPSLPGELKKAILPLGTKSKCYLVGRHSLWREGCVVIVEQPAPRLQCRRLTLSQNYACVKLCVAARMWVSVCCVCAHVCWLYMCAQVFMCVCVSIMMSATVNACAYWCCVFVCVHTCVCQVCMFCPWMFVSLCALLIVVLY